MTAMQIKGQHEVPYSFRSLFSGELEKDSLLAAIPYYKRQVSTECLQRPQAPAKSMSRVPAYAKPPRGLFSTQSIQRTGEFRLQSEFYFSL